MSEELRIVEYEGIRVVTTKQIAEAYEADVKQVSQGFNRNKAKFTEGKHYFLLRGNDLKAFRLKADLPSNIGRLYLWTDKGALLMAKIIDTEKAWQAYERLVDFYFEVKEEFNPPIEKFPEEQPRITYQTSSTPVPKNPSWQARNRRRINALCEKANTSVSTLYHHILLRLGEEYDLNAANRIYEEELGHVPKYAMDIVSYFPELARMADTYLDKLEEVTEKQLNKDE